MLIFTLDKMGIKETDKKKMKAFVGPALDESFMKFCGFDKEGATHHLTALAETEGDNVYLEKAAKILSILFDKEENM